MITLLNYIHVWIFKGIFFTLFDVLLFVHIKSNIQSLQKKINAHYRYLDATHTMEARFSVSPFPLYSVSLSTCIYRFPEVSQEEMKEGDRNCIICLDEMKSAKRLPCGHVYHHHCLRKWLEANDTCPYCRQPILEGEEATKGVCPPVVDVVEGDGEAAVEDGVEGDTSDLIPGNPDDGQMRDTSPDDGQMRDTSVFSISTSGWGSWFPAFSFEVVRTTLPIDENTIRRVAEIFPHISEEVIVADLELTSDVDATIENLLREEAPY